MTASGDYEIATVATETLLGLGHALNVMLIVALNSYLF